MANLEMVRKIALSLPDTREGEGGQFAVSVMNKGKAKGFIWTWLERVDPRKARVPNEAVLAVRVPSLEVKDALLATDGDKFFTEPHYDGYPAVLVRLAKIRKAELEELIRQAWRCQAPAALVKTVR